ncbi:MAG: M20/M25/M40 family metallo-hydrolase [Anaerolineales bacterium]|nr:M20/M25/M40 family metallo-hydrolase [Anaerolineales bacterium]
MRIMVKIDNNFLLETLRTLVSINSVLPHEAEAAAYLAEVVRGLGLEPEWDEIEAGRPNVYTTAVLGPSERFLVFSGHHDTVGVAPEWETNPFEMVEKNGRLYGLGIYNMKAGLACQLAAIKALLETPALHGKLGKLGFAATVDQEGGSIGAKAMLNTAYGQCDAMLHGEHFYGDAANDYLPLAGVGKLLYKLTIHGQAAHGFRPYQGINAVTDAARIELALADLPLPTHELFGQGTVCTLKFDGGYRQYEMVVPARCEMVINRLLMPGETRETAVSELRTLIDQLGLASTVTIETPPPFFNPYFLDQSTPLLPVFNQAYAQVVGRPPHFAPHNGITDVNVFTAEGNIPTIAFGPKGARHHMAGEYVELATLEKVARVYAETAVSFLSNR